MAVKQKKNEAIVEEEQPEEDPAEAKRLRKAAKRAAKEAAAENVETPEKPEKLKKAKKASKLADEEEDPAEAKKAKKAAKVAAAETEETPAETEEVDAVAAKKARKAAKRAAAELAAGNAEAVDDEAEVLSLEKRARKAAKKAAKEAAALESNADVEAKEESEPVKEETQKAAPSGDDEEDFTVFVRGLPYSCEEATLRKDFEECGEVLNLNMPLQEDGRCRGIAFVKYANKAGMEAAIKFDGEPYGGRYLEVKRATPKDDKGKGKGEKGKGDKGKGKGEKGEKGKGKGSANSDFAVFVGGLPFSVTEEQVRAHFAECGEVESVRMPTYEDGSPKGIAFVRFTNEEDVQSAIGLNGSDLEGRSITVRKAGDNPKKGDGKGKDSKGGKDGKDGKGKGKDGKDGKGKKGKGKKGGLSAEQKAAKDGAIVAPTGTVKKFDDDSDDE